MKQGFTLLELIVVIIIIGVLATLGLGQYMRMVEKSRGAEARSIIGAIRSDAAGIYMANNNSCNTAPQLCDNDNLGIGATGYPGPVIANCRATHYFAYSTIAAATGVTIRADRCGAAGKPPAGNAVDFIQDIVNFAAGTDAVTQSAAY